ncbi:hypothetical protein T4C_3675 [Trichinella pseudospiralis]|uniref:Uncharacterized protein n=1 Tax=Trichinella pseudospiralis TaxID=6337 RepID=A0A0V1GJ54_TRIPS|nr:hypothetical protein T4C_3675 [Trichinella pseudospiralis]
MLQQFCLKKAAMGLVKRMKQNWDRTTFDMTKCLYCFNCFETTLPVHCYGKLLPQESRKTRISCNVKI